MGKTEVEMNAIVFDGDETLWICQHLYDRSYARFLLYLYETLPSYSLTNIHHVYSVLFSHEEKNARTWGIGRGRVAQSMVDTYRQLCREYEELYGDPIYDPAAETTIHEIGDEPFDLRKHVWLPRAEKTLAALADKKHALFLITKYEETLWKRKAKALRVNRFFAPKNVLVVPNSKTPQDFQSVIEGSGQSFERCFAVGNSKNDLVVVTETDDKRWQGIFIPRPTSSPVEHDVNRFARRLKIPTIDHPRVVTLKSIHEIVEHVS